jgi:hypothetical protein
VRFCQIIQVRTSAWSKGAVRVRDAEILYIVKWAACDVCHMEWALDLFVVSCAGFWECVCGCLLMDCLGCVGRYLDGCFVTWYSNLLYYVGRRRKQPIVYVTFV